LILPESSNQYWLPLFELLLEDDRACVKIVLSRASKNPASATIRSARFRVAPERSFYTCPGCHEKFKKTDAYRWYDNNRGSGYGYCSEDCHDKYFSDMNQRYAMKGICSILKSHDEELKDDNERLDIKKFLHVYIECDK